MKILEDNRRESGWITCVIEGRWVQAKVYDEPSDYGVYKGRVSKLAIGKCDHTRPFENFFEQMAYNYDRGLDFNNLPKGLLKKIVNELEKLPRAFSPQIS